MMMSGSKVSIAIIKSSYCLDKEKLYYEYLLHAASTAMCHALFITIDPLVVNSQWVLQLLKDIE